MTVRRFITFALLLLSAVGVRGQAVCSARIVVTDTVLVDGHGEEPDSVRYLLRSPQWTDLLHWEPEALFADPQADSQWVTVSCNDTLRVFLTAWYDTANLLRWSEPGYLARHTAYNFVASPTAGDFCHPRSLALDYDASLYCPGLEHLSGLQMMVYADTSAPSDHYGTITTIPKDSTFVPFYVDTVDIHSTGWKHDLHVHMIRLSEMNNPTRTIPYFFLEAVYADTTIVYRFGVSFVNGVGTIIPLPRGDRVILRFYEKSSSTFPTVTAFNIYDFEILDYCEAHDSVTLAGPKCNCHVRDSLFAYVCKSDLPYAWGKIVFDEEGTVSDTLPGRYCDTVTTYHLSVIPSSDTTIYDTVLEEELPRAFLDSLFYDEVENVAVVLYNEAGCDSTIYYNLHVFWNGDHCDSSLTFPTLVTPNGDGTNDRFVIGGLLENDCFKFNDLYVYDRTGQLVYHGHNIASEDDFWNPDSPRAPAATYFYVFKAHGVTIHTMRQGFIEVLR